MQGRQGVCHFDIHVSSVCHFGHNAQNVLVFNEGIGGRTSENRLLDVVEQALGVVDTSVSDVRSSLLSRLSR